MQLTNKLSVEWHCRHCEADFRDYVTYFVSLFGTNSNVLESFDGLYGRILRGRTQADFATLSERPDRQVGFFVDSRALRGLIGLDGLTILTRLGYPDIYIRYLLKEQLRFRLLLTKAIDTKKASWDNLLDIVCDLYPDWRERVEMAEPILKKQTYIEVMQSQGHVKEVRAS